MKKCIFKIVRTTAGETEESLKILYVYSKTYKDTQQDVVR